MDNRIKVKDAAKVMGISQEAVRCGMVHKEFPFGAVIKMSKHRNIYHIPADQLADYMGISVEKLEGMI